MVKEVEIFNFNLEEAINHVSEISKQLGVTSTGGRENIIECFKNLKIQDRTIAKSEKYNKNMLNVNDAILDLAVPLNRTSKEAGRTSSLRAGIKTSTKVDYF